MAEHPNATLAREIVERAQSEGAQVMGEYMTDDIVWHEIGLAEPRRGKAELAAASADIDYEVDWTVHDIVASDDHVVLLIEATGKRGGKTLDYRVAEVYNIKDGKFTERWAVSDDTRAIARFFA